jgi:hypothetical protein
MTTKTTQKSRMGESPLNRGLLESTLLDGPVVDNESPVEMVSDQQTPPGKENSQITTKDPADKAISTSQKQGPLKEEIIEEEGGEDPSASSNPFGYNLEKPWPLVSYKKPYIIPVPEIQRKASSAISIRVSYDLNMTIEKHRLSLGILNLSEWVREALERQLSVEQDYLSRKNSNNK